MGRIAALLLIISLLLSGCTQGGRQEESAASQPQASTGGQPAEESAPEPPLAPAKEESAPEESADTSWPEEPVQGRPNYHRDESRRADERERCIKENPGARDVKGVEIIHTDRDPQDNDLALSLAQANEVINNNLALIINLPERYAAICTGIDEIGDQSYYCFEIEDHTRTVSNAPVVGTYYVNGETGGFYRLDKQTEYDFLVPLN